MNINQLTSNSSAQTAHEYLDQAGVTRAELDALRMSQPPSRTSMAHGPHAIPPRIMAVPRSRLLTQAGSAAGQLQSGPFQGQIGMQVWQQGQYITPTAAATAPPPGPTLQQQAAAIRSAMAAVPGYDPQGSKLNQYRAIRQYDADQGMNWSVIAMQFAVDPQQPSYFSHVDREFEPDTAEAAEVRRAAQASQRFANAENGAQKYRALLDLKEQQGKNWSKRSMSKIAGFVESNAARVENAHLPPTGIAKAIHDEVLAQQTFRTKTDAYRATLDYNDANARNWAIKDMRRAVQIDSSQAADIEFHRAPDWAEVTALRNAVQNEPEHAQAQGGSAKQRYEALLTIKRRVGATWAERDMVKLSGILFSNAIRVHRDLGLPTPHRPAPGRT